MILGFHHQLHMFVFRCSPAVDLLAAHRSQPGRPARPGDRSDVQDGQGSLQPAGKGLDTEIRHVTFCRPVFTPNIAHHLHPSGPSTNRNTVSEKELQKRKRPFTYFVVMYGESTFGEIHKPVCV